MFGYILLRILSVCGVLLVISGTVFLIFNLIMLMIEKYRDDFGEIFVGGHQPKNRPENLTPPTHGPAYKPNKEVKNG